MNKKTGRIEEMRPVSVEAKRQTLEERQMTERDHVRPRRAFREGGHDRDEFCAGFREQLLHGEERATGRDDVVDDDHLLAGEECRVVRPQEERLFLVGRDTLHRDLENGLGHVGLVLLPGDDGRELGHPTEDMEQGLRLAVRHDEHFRTRRDELGELGPDGFVELPVAERVEERDPNPRCDLPDGESPHDSADRDRMRGLHDELRVSGW